jgi:hypothetical protein
MIFQTTEWLRTELKRNGRHELAARGQFEIPTDAFQNYLILAKRQHAEYSEEEHRGWAAYCCLTAVTSRDTKGVTEMDASGVSVRTMNELLAVMIQRSKDEELRHTAEEMFRRNVVTQIEQQRIDTDVHVSQLSKSIDKSRSDQLQSTEAIAAHITRRTEPVKPMFPRWLVIAVFVLLFLLIGVDIAKGQGITPTNPCIATATAQSYTSSTVTHVPCRVALDGSLVVTVGGTAVTITGTVTANQGTAAAASGAWPIIVTDATNTAIVDACASVVKTTDPFSVTADAVLIAAASNKKNYICSIVVVASAAEIVGIVEGTGSTCGTNTTAIAGSTTDANSMSFGANGGFAAVGGIATTLAGKGTNVDTCIRLSGSNRVAGWVTYVQR